MMQATSPRGIVALMRHEGIVPGPYLDSATPPVWTFGVGHTKAAGGLDPATVRRGMPSDLDHALRLVADTFRADLQKYESGVRRAFTRPLTQAQFDAAVSFHFNTGAIYRVRPGGVIVRPDWVEDFNSGGGADGILNWRKPSSIIPRREAELRLFQTGKYPTGDVIVWGVDSQGHVIWTPIRRLSEAEALALVSPPPDQDTIKTETTKAPSPGLFAALMARLKGR